MQRPRRSPRAARSAPKEGGTIHTVEIPLRYGAAALIARLPAASLIGVFAPRPAGAPPGALDDERALVEQALARPVGSPPLDDVVRPRERVAIVTSDLTRPCPSGRLLEPVLDALAAAGVRAADTTVITALGLHRPMSAEELESAVGPRVWGRVRVLNHDPADVVALGVTSAGTPVELFRPLVEADRRVCLGNLEFHYFAGFSGGAKAILPGCANRATIQANHARMLEPGAVAGRLAGNPVRADIEEGAALVGVDFILNVLTDDQQRIEAAVAGDVTAAHRLGCEWVLARGATEIPALADVVLVSAGGYPKDVNLYQAQKALDHALLAVRPGGVVVLVAECREGLGNAAFERWMREARSPDDLLRRVRRGFELGGHKAAAIAKALDRAQVLLVSALPPETVRLCMLEPYQRLEDALSAALEAAGPAAQVIVLPEGGSILPVVAQR